MYTNYCFVAGTCCDDYTYKLITGKERSAHVIYIPLRGICIQITVLLQELVVMTTHTNL